MESSSVGGGEVTCSLQGQVQFAGIIGLTDAALFIMFPSLKQNRVHGKTQLILVER